MKVLFSRDKAEEEQARLTERKRSEMGRWRLLYRIVLPPLAGESGASAMQCTASPNRIISDQLVFVFEMRLESTRCPELVVTRDALAHLSGLKTC
jgi:hypothetical protein